VVSNGRLIVLGTVVAAAAILTGGAVVGAKAHDKVQDVVQVEIVNDTASRVQMTICEDSECKVVHDWQTVAPGENFDQALGANDDQQFAIFSSGLPSLSPVAGRTYRCGQLVSGAKVLPTYPLSSLSPCGG